MNLTGRIFRKLIPRFISYPLTRLKVLEVDYGDLVSTFRWACVDQDGHPIPWYTYPAIEYLEQLDFSTRTIFEYGSGNSSLFWARQAKQVFSVEGNEKWYRKVLEMSNASNLTLILLADKKAYIEEILRYSEEFDVIIIDGLYRKECAEKAIKKLKPGGLIILDNADWFPEIAKFIRESLDLIQIDMKGFAPINFYTSTTSLFFHRDSRFLPKGEIQPSPGRGSIEKRGN